MSWVPIPPELGPGRFPYFACYLLRELGLAQEPTKQQLRIADWQENGPNRSITVGFRGVAKSTITAFRALHRLRIDPFNEKVLIPGSTAEKAMEITTFMARCIRDIDILRCLEPRSDGRSSTKAFDVGPAVVDQSPSTRAVGILSPALTGKRATAIFPDDIETLNNSITPLKQERLWTATTELEAILKPDEAGQALPRVIAYLGTPHLETSLYWRLVRERGYKIRLWPCRYPDPSDPEVWDAYEGCIDPLMAEELELNPGLVGRPTDPERFDEEELLRREMGSTKVSWQLQYMLNCRLSTLDKFPIRLGDLIVMDLDGKALPEVVAWSASAEHRMQSLPCVGLGADRFYHSPAVLQGWVPAEETWRCAMFIDPSGRGSDELAWAVGAELNGNIFALESGGTTRGYEPEVLVLLAKRAARWNVSYVIAESNMGDGMFTALLQPVMQKVHQTSIEERRSSGQKERRIIDTLAPLVQQHRLVFNTELIRSDWAGAERDQETGHARSLMFQMSRITVERGSLQFDDRIDALAGLCAFFVEAAAQDQVKAAAARQEELEQAARDAWFDETGSHIDALALGYRPTPRKLAHGGVRR
ncbi:MAG: phage terminase large subunit [Cyanobacteriota bacterium]|nr:phage terminase large subunit [Cyanobacteriota bacterium]